MKGVGQAVTQPTVSTRTGAASNAGRTERNGDEVRWVELRWWMKGNEGRSRTEMDGSEMM
jgi:hypothetical protein